MRLCANENVAEDCVRKLRRDGHDVLGIRESAAGSSDSEVLARAQSEDRLLITFDKDFGQLVFQAGAEASPGVILFRILQPSSTATASRMAMILATRNDWAGHFSVVDEFGVRMRKLPQANEG